MVGSMLASGTEAPLEVAISGVDSNTATIALGYADAIVESYSQEWMIHRFGRLGPTKVQVPLNVCGRVRFNADMESKNYIVPGLIAVIMMVIAAMLTSLASPGSGSGAPWNNLFPRRCRARNWSSAS